MSKMMIESKEMETLFSQTDERFRIMADSAPVALWMSGPDSLCTFFNQGWLNFTGRNMAQEIGSGWVEGVHPEDLQNCMDTYLSAFNARKEFKMEYRLRRHDGQYRWILDHGAPFYSLSGSFAGYIGSCTDITERKLYEKELKERAEELERLNKELEQFAYVASHDLQEPLRIITCYVELLARDFKDKLGGKADQYIQYIVDGAKRMQSLISGLLECVHLGKKEKITDTVDMQAALNQALNQLTTSIQESGATITIGSLPVIAGNETLITQLFQNLIANAIKFRGQKPPEIQIAAEKKGNEWIFFVRDNGIGIAKSYFDKIFVLFERLHANNAFPGNGIGLALCKRIVERHNGKIWVESKLWEGSTFYFSLPAKG